jgi:hypothetical protein
MEHWSYETLGINSRVDVLSSNGWPTLSQPTGDRKSLYP